MNTDNISILLAFESPTVSITFFMVTTVLITQRPTQQLEVFICGWYFDLVTEIYVQSIKQSTTEHSFEKVTHNQ